MALCRWLLVMPCLPLPLIPLLPPEPHLEFEVRLASPQKNWPMRGIIMRAMERLPSP